MAPAPVTAPVAAPAAKVAVAPPPPPPAPPAPASAPVARAAPPAPAAPSPAVEAPPAAEGTQIFTGFHIPKVEATLVELKQDGSAGKILRLTKETLIGQTSCDLSYPADVLLSERHASIALRGEKVILKDLGSRNGTFIKQRKDMDLASGDVFLTGRQLFRFITEAPPEEGGDMEGTRVMMGVPKLQAGSVAAKIERIQLTGEVVETFKLEKPETTLGRTRGDLTFKTDPYMSGEHARIKAQAGGFVLQDLKSRNGVYRRIRNEVELRDRDEFFLGEQIFRVEIKVA
ncbi:MAG: FHA domain-containing protein [Terriglobia bacterium]